MNISVGRLKYFMKINNIFSQNRKFDSGVTDEEIDSEMSKLISQFPNAGNVIKNLEPDNSLKDQWLLFIRLQVSYREIQSCRTCANS